MSHLLDTCVLSEFERKQPNPKVIAWLDSRLEESLFISAITIGEIQKGISLLSASRRRNDLSLWLENVVYRYDERILPVTTPIMREWGRLMAKLEKKGRILPMLDSLIASTALVHELTLVTRNDRDFVGSEVSVLNIWPRQMQ